MAAPVVVLVVGLALLAVVAAVAVRGPGERAVRPTVAGAQDEAAAAAVVDVTGQARQAVDAVLAAATRTAPTSARDPAAALSDLTRTVPATSGAVVVDTASGATLAQRGLPPAERGLPAGSPVVSTVEPDRPPRVVVSAPTGPDRTVFVATDLRLPPVPSGGPAGLHTVVTTTGGAVLGTAGASAGGERPGEVGVIARAAARSEYEAEGDVADATALADTSRDPALPVASGHFTTVGVPSGAGSDRLAVVALAPGSPQVTAPERPGLPVAVGLLVLAAVVGLVLHRTVVRPIRRVRADTDGAVADLRAGLEPRPVLRSAGREVDAVAVTFRRAVGHRDDGPLPDGTRARIVVPAVAVLVVAALAGGVAGVTGAVTASTTTAGTDGSARLGATERLAGEATEDLRGQLSIGAARVARAATPQLADPTGGDLAPRADALAASPGPFRSVAVVDDAGTVRHVAGRPPLRTTEAVPRGAGLAQLNIDGRLPLLVAHAWAPNGAGLVAEFDTGALSELLRRQDLRTRVVDPGQRTLLDSHGHEAFARLADPELAAAASVAQGDTVSTSATRVDGSADATVALPVGEEGPTEALGLALVAQQDEGAAALREDRASRAALVVAGIGGVLAVATAAWLWLVVLGPLRRAASAPDGVHGHGGADRPVERLDEVGAVVANLNAARRLVAPGGR